MRVRLFFSLVALIPVALLTAQDRPTAGGVGQPGSSPPAGGGSTAGQITTTGPLDGSWTVVSAAREGLSVNGADKMAVTISGNVVTFAGGTGQADPARMRPLRLDFGPYGTLRVVEAGADGKFPVPPPGATVPPGTAPAPGTLPRTPAPSQIGRLAGVYVLTPDYLAISVFEVAGTGLGTSTTGGATAPATGTPRPGAATPGAGTPVGISPAGTPQMKTHLSVILRRAGGSGGTPSP